MLRTLPHAGPWAAASLSTTLVVVSGGDDHRSGHLCQIEMHPSCPHKNGGGVRLFGSRTDAMAQLCNCICHSACPIANQREVADEEWVQQCTCPGSDALREIGRRVREEGDLRKS